jgi:hypothetical protein
MVPAVQARVTLRAPQTFLGYWWGSPQTTRVLQTLRELGQFLRQHQVSIRQVADRRYPVLHQVLPDQLKQAASRVISDEQGRLYDENETGARELATAVADEAYGSYGIGGEQEPQWPPSPVSLSIPSYVRRYSAGELGGSTSTFDYLSGLAASVPVPKAVGDYGSRQVRAKIQEHASEHPVVEGIQDAFKGRAEAVTRIPQDPRKAVDVLPWADYYINAGGAKDLQRSMDIAASKMSPEEGKQFKEDFEKLKFDREMKLAAGAGASIAVGQGIGLIPHPAAKAVQVAWTATGAVAANNKLADVKDKLEQFEKAHPKAYQVMEEHRDQQLASLNANRRERLKEIEKDVKEHLASPWG